MANVTSEDMGRAEVQLFDGIRNISILTVVVSLMMFLMGRSAMRTTEKKKSKVAQRMFGRHFFLFLAFLVFYVFTRKQTRAFKDVFDKLKEGDKNVASITSMKAADVVKTPKRNLKAMYIDLDNMFQRYQVPEEMKMMMDDMRFAGNEIMANMTEDMDRMFQRHPIPQEVRDLMNDIHGFHKDLKRGHHYEEEPLDVEDDESDDEFDGRKMAYRMFAPGLYEQAMKKERGHRHGRHHGPSVRADKGNKKDAVKDWPKMHAMCPVMLFFIIASIYQICHIKFLEKALAKLEFLRKAQKIVKKKLGKKQERCAPAQKANIVPVVPQQVQMVVKEQAAPNMAQPLIMPVMPLIQKQKPMKVQDVEEIPTVNESFDYSMSDPLVDGLTDIVSEPDEASHTGFVASKNSMM